MPDITDTLTPVRPVNPVPKSGTGTGRGRKKGVPPKVRPEIPEAQVVVIQMGAKESADARRKREPRSDRQKQIDQIVYNIYQANLARGLAGGTIADWSDLEIYDWPIGSEYVETAQWMVTKAALFYGRRVIYGEITYFRSDTSHELVNPELDEAMACPMNGQNHAHIPFTVVRQPPKKKAVED